MGAERPADEAEKVEEEEKKKKEEQEEEGISIRLASLVAAAAGLVSAIGALAATGTLGRVQRNHDLALKWAIWLVALGALAWLLGTVFKDWRAILIAAAGVLTVAGVGTGYDAAIDSVNDTEQPAIDVTLDRGALVVRGRATVANLASDESLTVAVHGAVREDRRRLTRRPRFTRRWRFTRLWRSVRGPDGDGNAETAIAVGLPSGRFDAVRVRAFTGKDPGRRCGSYKRSNDEDGGTACQLIHLVTHPNPPQLAAAWSEEAERRTLAIRLRSSGTGVRDVAPRPLMLSVVGQGYETTERLYRAVYLPRALGPLRRGVEVGIPAGIWRVCVRARFAVPGKPLGATPCPLRGTRASVELRVPASYGG